MPGEDSNPQGWTFETLLQNLTDKIDAVDQRLTGLSAASKEAVTAALAAAKEAIAAAMIASEKAILKAEAAADKRAEASNEIRAAMMDQQKTFANKSETDLRLSSIEKRLDATANKSQGVGMLASIIFSIIMAAVAVGALAINFMRH